MIQIPDNDRSLDCFHIFLNPFYIFYCRKRVIRANIQNNWNFLDVLNGYRGNITIIVLIIVGSIIILLVLFLSCYLTIVDDLAPWGPVVLLLIGLRHDIIWPTLSSSRMQLCSARTIDPASNPRVAEVIWVPDPFIPKPPECSVDHVHIVPQLLEKAVGGIV